MGIFFITCNNGISTQMFFNSSKKACWVEIIVVSKYTFSRKGDDLVDYDWSFSDSSSLFTIVMLFLLGFTNFISSSSIITQGSLLIIYVILSGYFI